MFDKFSILKKSGLFFFSLCDLAILLGLKPASTAVIASRLVKKGILLRLKKDLFLLAGTQVNDFEIGNRLLTPSYISFESALSYWGMTTQIPSSVTSASLRSKKIMIQNLKKEFSYSKLSPNCFPLGIIKEANFLIASPEKALLDMAYYQDLGRRSLTFDELNLKKIDPKKMKKYLAYYPQEIKKMIKDLLP